MRGSLALGAVLAVALVGCVKMSGQSGRSASQVSDAPATHQHRQQLVSTVYQLGTADQLDIRVYRHPELTQQVVIASDGTFVFPRIGVVRAVGLTITRLEKELTQRLVDTELEAPRVAVSVTEYHNRHVYVLGAVKSPGVYTLPAEMSLQALIATANGPTNEAAHYILVVRGESHQDRDGRHVKVRHLESLPGIRVDLNKLLAGEVDRNVHLHSGDLVYIPRRVFYFAGRNVGQLGLTSEPVELL